MNWVKTSIPVKSPCSGGKCWECRSGGEQLYSRGGVNPLEYCG